MARYYLNVRSGSVLIEDPDGEDAQDLPSLRRIAQDTMEDILRRPETYGETQRWERCSIEVTDEAGAIVLTLPFSESGEST